MSGTGEKKMGSNLLKETDKNVQAMALDYPAEAPIEPMWDVLLIRPSEQKAPLYMRSPGGVLITGEATKTEPVEGVVLAKGEGLINPDGSFTAVPIQAGTTILYHLHDCEQKTVDGHRYHLLRSRDVIGKMRK